MDTTRLMAEWQKIMKDEAVAIDMALYNARMLPGVQEVKTALSRRLDVVRKAFSYCPPDAIQNIQGRAQLLEELLNVIEKGPIEMRAMDADLAEAQPDSNEPN
jgi:hypothetical protein